jgi:hypothetical protein
LQNPKKLRHDRIRQNFIRKAMVRKVLFCRWWRWWWWNCSHCVQRARERVWLISKPRIIFSPPLYTQTHIPSIVLLRRNNCVLLGNLLSANQNCERQLFHSQIFRMWVPPPSQPLSSPSRTNLRALGIRNIEAKRLDEIDTRIIITSFEVIKYFHINARMWTLPDRIGEMDL